MAQHFSSSTDFLKIGRIVELRLTAGPGYTQLIKSILCNYIFK